MRLPSIPGTLAVVFLLLALPACQHDRTQSETYNLWKERCYELSAVYKVKLKHPPYHMIADQDGDRCSTPDPAFQWDADSRNMYILVANLFYHYDMKIRRQALELLERYHCELDFNCGELADLLDAHIKASLADQSPAWKAELHPRVRDFWRHLNEDKR